MEEKSTDRKLRTAIVLCSVFFLLVIFRHNIDVFFKGINYLLWMAFMLIIFLVLAVSFARSIRRSIKKKKQHNLKTHLPAFIYTLTLILCYIVPSSETFESDAIIVAQNEGTQSQNTIKFRTNKTFEMNSTAVFGYNEWFTGTYTKKGDTLLLSYDTPSPKNMGNKLLQVGRKLIVIDKPQRKDSLYCCQTFLILKKNK